MRQQTAEMFHAANVAFTSEQRQAYNFWRSKVTRAEYRLVDALELADIPTLHDDPVKDEAYERLQELRTLISMAPDVMTED